MNKVAEQQVILAEKIATTGRETAHNIAKMNDRNLKNWKEVADGMAGRDQETKESLDG